MYPIVDFGSTAPGPTFLDFHGSLAIWREKQENFYKIMADFLSR